MPYNYKTILQVFHETHFFLKGKFNAMKISILEAMSFLLELGGTEGQPIALLPPDQVVLAIAIVIASPTKSIQKWQDGLYQQSS